MKKRDTATVIWVTGRAYSRYLRCLKYWNSVKAKAYLGWLVLSLSKKSTGGSPPLAPTPSCAHHCTHFIFKCFRAKLLTVALFLSVSVLILVSHCVVFPYICLCAPEAKQRPYYADYSPLRLSVHTLCTSHYLDLFITFIICINVFTMSIEHYNQPQVVFPHISLTLPALT